MGYALVGLALATGCRAAAADDPDYDIRVVAETTIEVGATAAVSVTLVPGTGHTVSGDGPVRLSVSGDAGLGLPRRRYRRADAADPAAEVPRFDVRVKALADGDHRLELDVRFWLCGARLCRPIRTTRAVVVHVPAAPVDAAPVDAGAADAGRAGAVDARRR